MRYDIDTNKVVWRNVEGEVVILNLESGHYYGLNKTGSKIWSALSQNKILKDTVEEISDKYQIPSQKAAKDAADLVRLLEKEGLISPAV